MSNTLLNFSAAESAIRKRWVWAHAWQTTLFNLLMVGLFGLMGRREIAGEFLAYAFGGLIWFWVGYHCAYKKRGTKWLTFWLVVSPVGLLVELVGSAKEMQDMQGMVFILYLVLLAATTAFFGWWYSMTLKMRKINRKEPVST